MNEIQSLPAKSSQSNGETDVLLGNYKTRWNIIGKCKTAGDVIEVPKKGPQKQSGVGMGFQGDFLEKVVLVLRLKIDAIVYLEKFRENDSPCRGAVKHQAAIRLFLGFFFFF